MFYPSILPHAADGVPAERSLDIESAVVELLITGDRDFIRRADLLLATERELVFLGLVRATGDDAAQVLLAANESPLRRFVAEQVLMTEPYVHWEWLQPDWEQVGRELGAGVIEEWRAKLAEYERGGRINQRKLEAVPVGEAAA